MKWMSKCSARKQWHIGREPEREIFFLLGRGGDWALAALSWTGTFCALGVCMIPTIIDRVVY